MTSTFLGDKNNDLYIGRDGNLAFGTDLDAVLDAAQTAAQAQLGEMILALTDGVPNFQTIWESATNIAQFEAYLRRVILAVDGVQEIQSLDINVRDNKLSYVANIVSIYGSGTFLGGQENGI